MNSSAQTLMALWLRHKPTCRGIGSILADARAGRLPGVAADETPGSFIIRDEAAALAAMAAPASDIRGNAT